jgi:hypothetical protein
VCRKISVLLIFLHGVFAVQKLHQSLEAIALETAASMPPKAMSKEQRTKEK